MLTQDPDDAIQPPEWDGVRQHRETGGAEGLRFALVISHFNLRHTAGLLRGAVEELQARGAAAGDIEVVWVPGAYEIPTAAEALAAGRHHHAILALGCVIQGETPHAGLINATVATALCEIARSHLLPVIDAVVPAQSESQAAARCGDGPSNRGRHAARAAIEMARLLAGLRARPS